MTRLEYLRALERLHYLPASKVTAEAFGVSVRQLQRYSRGDQLVEGPLEKLIEIMLKTPTRRTEK